MIAFEPRPRLRIGSGLRFDSISGSGSEIGFSNSIFEILRQRNHKKNFCKVLKDVM